MFGVSSRSVGTWWRKYRDSGRESLAAPVKSRAGREETISAEERGVLFGTIADYTPERLLIGGPMWTRAAVGELIRMVTGVRMTGQGVEVDLTCPIGGDPTRVGNCRRQRRMIACRALIPTSPVRDGLRDRTQLRLGPQSAEPTSMGDCPG